MLERFIGSLVIIGAAFVAGYLYSNHKAEIATAEALARAADDNRKHNDEVVNGWNHAVLDLRRRIRDGYAPKIPTSGLPPKADSPSSVDGTPANYLPFAGELETCKAERQRVIEDCASTTIQLKALQEWAK